MEYIQGRIITDPNLSTLPLSDRRAAWKSVISTLAWLHSIDPDAIGLSSFGKKTNFYARHCNTFSLIEAQQAQVRDITTGQQLGRAHPHFDEIVSYIRSHLPQERTCIIHGDYKFDNIILHPTEPRVIAILDWELSTLGHPLMDVVYVTGPYWNRASKVGIPGGPTVQTVRDDQGGDVYDEENQAQNGLPSMQELLGVYEKKAGWDPRQDRWDVARVFHLMRVSLLVIFFPSLSGGRELDGYRVQHKLTQISGKCDQPRYPSANHQRASQQLLLARLLRKHQTRTR